MRFRKTVVLLLATGFAAALAGLIKQQRPHVKGDESQPDPLIHMLPDEVAYLRIHRGELCIECNRTATGWRMTQPLTARADGPAIQRFLDTVSQQKRHETITAEQRHARGLTPSDYGLSVPRARIVMADAARRKRIEWDIGNDAPFGSLLYVQPRNKEDIVATESALRDVLPTDARDWRDRALVVGDPFLVNRADIARPDGGFVQLARIGSEWRIQQPFAARADGARVHALLNAVLHLRVRDFVWDPPPPSAPPSPSPSLTEPSSAPSALSPRPNTYGLTPDVLSARVALWIAGETPVELLFGRKTDDGNDHRYVMLKDSASVYTVDGEILSALTVPVMSLRQKRLFPFDPRRVARIEFATSDRKLTIERQPGTGWMLAEPVAWKADDEIVEDALSALTRWEAIRFPDPWPTNWSDIGLSPPRTIVALSSVRDDTPLGTNGLAAAPRTNDAFRARLWIGDTGETPDLRHAVFEGEQAVFFVRTTDADALLRLDADPLRFCDRTVLAVPPEEIVRLTLSTDEHREEIGRDRDGRWTAVPPGSNTVDSSAIEDILSRLAHLRALRVERQAIPNPAAYGLEDTSRKLTLDLRGTKGIRKTLRFGYRAGTDGIFVSVQGLDVVYVLSREDADCLTRGALRKNTPATEGTRTGTTK